MEYHRRSLENLSAAMRDTKRLCSVWLDTTGREVWQDSRCCIHWRCSVVSDAS